MKQQIVEIDLDLETLLRRRVYDSEAAAAEYWNPVAVEEIELDRYDDEIIGLQELITEEQLKIFRGSGWRAKQRESDRKQKRLARRMWRVAEQLVANGKGRRYQYGPEDLARFSRQRELMEAWARGEAEDEA